jgi:hypothetical protein
VLVRQWSLPFRNGGTPHEALPSFWGKRIRIFAHQDQAGEAAADRSTEQLKGTAKVFGFFGLRQSDGKPVKDLNDLLKISAESYRRSAKLIKNMMRL